MAPETIVWSGSEALRPFLVAIADLEPWPGNPRRGDVEAIRGSLRRFGQVKPLVVDGKRIVAGHHLARAAQEEGWTHVAVVQNDFGSEEEGRAFLLADNKVASLGTFDDEALLAQLQALEAVGLDGTGYSEADVADLDRQLQMLSDQEAFARAAGPNVADPDETPPLPEEPRSKQGEVYELGPHRLLCGDASDPEQVALLLRGDRPSLVWTDPPYGVAYRAMRRADAIAGDESEEEAASLLRDALRLANAEASFVCCSWRSQASTSRAMESVGLAPKACIVWDKGWPVQNLDRFAKQHEFVLYAGPFGGQKTVESDVWRIPRDYDPDHPTPKPVELVARGLRASTRTGEIVYDPFAGSGSALIAADVLGRRAFLAEIDPAYCDVIRDRYEVWAALPPEQRVPARPRRELVLDLDEDAHAKLTGVHMDVLMKELGVSTPAEAVAVACARVARDLNQAA